MVCNNIPDSNLAIRGSFTLVFTLTASFSDNEELTLTQHECTHRVANSLTNRPTRIQFLWVVFKSYNTQSKHCFQSYLCQLLSFPFPFEEWDDSLAIQNRLSLFLLYLEIPAYPGRFGKKKNPNSKTYSMWCTVLSFGGKMRRVMYLPP